MTRKEQREKTKARKEKIAEIKVWAENNECDVTFLGNKKDRHLFADAILGTTDRPHPAIVYLRSKIIEAFMEINGWDEEAAEEWYEYNTVRALPYIKAEDGPFIIVDDIIV